MQDRFRFRAWYTDYDKNTEMIYDVQGTYDTGCCEDYPGSSHHDRFQDVLMDSNAIVMQCTGLKDKNGKLIYEGDIIRVQYIGAQIPLFSRQFSNLPKDEIFAIIYDHDWHKFRCENPNYKKTCEIHSLDLDAIQINTENKQYEIIGNIYQNPELLEVE
nr:MAG TPA: YopX protein [Caudoviricetes sp.]